MELVLKLTAFRENPSLVKGEVEEKTLLKGSLRKASYTSEADGHNLKTGTGIVWGNVTIQGFDDAAFAEFNGLDLGDEIVVTVRPRKVGKK